MNILEMLTGGSGQGTLVKLAGELGLGTAETNNVLTSVAPALGRGLQRQMMSSQSLSALQAALKSGGHRRYLDDPDLMSSDASRIEGNKILGHVFGSKNVSRNVAAQAATSTGVDVSLIKKALPFIAGLAMGAISKTSNSGESLEGIGLGSLADSGDFGLDDVLDIAKKLF